MDEIIIISFLYFAASAFSLAAGVKMFFVAREKEKSRAVRYFFYGLLFIALYLLINGLPGFYEEGYFPVFVLVSLFRPFLIIGGMFFCLIPLHLMGSEKIERIYTYAALFVVILSSGLSFFEITRQLPAEHFLARYGPNIVALFFILSLLFAGVFYFRHAFKKRKKKVVFGRSIMIGTGCVLFLLGASFKYVLETAIQDPVFAGIVASLAFIMGSVSFVASITYKGEKTKDKIMIKGKNYVG